VKRDLNLVRELLLRLEPLPAHPQNPIAIKIGEPPLDIQGYTNDEIAYNLQTMADGDLLYYINIGSDGRTIPHFCGLRWTGHEFLDDVRNPEAWRDIMDQAKRYGGVGLKVAWELAKAYMKKHGLDF